MTKMESADSTEKEQLKQQLEAHKTIAQEGYEAFSYDQELSQQSWS